MDDRSISPARGRVLRRHRVRHIQWNALVISPDWASAHRSARIAARVAATRERQMALMLGRGRRCGL